MRFARWSGLLLPLVLGCEVPTAPSLPDGAQRFTPPPVYQLWWAMTQECSQRTRSVADVRWYFVPGSRSIIVNGERFDGFWYASGNSIVVTEGSMFDGTLVRHEMLHSLLGAGEHARADFLGRCGGVVVCTGRCLEDAGPLAPPDPGIARVTPDALEVHVVVTSETPSSAQHGGYFTMTVTARNPRNQPVVLTLPPSGDAGPEVTFEYRIEGEGFTVMSGDRAWDDGVTRFDPGEVKRRVFDFHRIGISGVTGDGGLGPGTYRFNGGYGKRWAPTPPTVTLSAP